MAAVVEAQPIYDSLIPWQPENARPRIASLCARRHRADLGETAAEAEHGVGHAGVLVEAGGDADGVGKCKASKARGEAGMIRRRTRKKAKLQGFERRLVRLLRWQQRQQRGGEIEDPVQHCRTPCGRMCAPFVSSSSGKAARTAAVGRLA